MSRRLRNLKMRIVLRTFWTFERERLGAAFVTDRLARFKMLSILDASEGGTGKGGRGVRKQLSRIPREGDVSRENCNIFFGTRFASAAGVIPVSNVCGFLSIKHGVRSYGRGNAVGPAR